MFIGKDSSVASSVYARTRHLVGRSGPGWQQCSSRSLSAWLPRVHTGTQALLLGRAKCIYQVILKKEILFNPLGEWIKSAFPIVVDDKELYSFIFINPHRYKQNSPLRFSLNATGF